MFYIMHQLRGSLESNRRRHETSNDCTAGSNPERDTIGSNQLQYELSSHDKKQETKVGCESAVFHTDGQ